MIVLRLTSLLSVLTLAIAEFIPEAIRDSDDPQTLITNEFVGNSFSFLITGDFGGFPEPFYSTQLQRNVAAILAENARDYDCKFVLELGDNFYFLGVKDVYDRRWKGTFEDVYSDPALYIPWYPTTGNHDWHGSVQAQIDYSKLSTRWTFPWYWYTLDHILRPSGVKIRIIMFETTIPCGLGARPDGVPLDEAMTEKEYAWLEQQLIDGQDADYLIVTGHYPIYSAGNAGPDVPCLHNRLDPLLLKYNVQAYISGHDHNVQHLVAPGEDLNYVVIGCSNFVTPYFSNEDSDMFEVKKTWASWGNLLTGCFARADVSTEEMAITIMDGKEGNTIHTIKLPNRKKSNF